MKLRIAIWAAVGALVVMLWNAYLITTHNNPHGAVLTFLCVTCPIALVRHRPMTFYIVLATNTATYALAGALLETFCMFFRNTRRLAH